MVQKEYDVMIVGTAPPGLYAALQFEKDVRVLLVCKKELTLSNSSLAQGGVAAVIDKNHDDFKLHIATPSSPADTRTIFPPWRCSSPRDRTTCSTSRTWGRLRSRRQGPASDDP